MGGRHPDGYGQLKLQLDFPLDLVSGAIAFSASPHVRRPRSNRSRPGRVGGCAASACGGGAVANVAAAAACPGVLDSCGRARSRSLAVSAERGLTLGGVGLVRTLRGGDARRGASALTLHNKGPHPATTAGPRSSRGTGARVSQRALMAAQVDTAAAAPAAPPPPAVAAVCVVGGTPSGDREALDATDAVSAARPLNERAPRHER